ncbi:MAG: hypothetical protein OHK0013_12210 [Sandaracinaceae bacterium]
MPVVPTHVDVEGPFVYARLLPKRGLTRSSHAVRVEGSRGRGVSWIGPRDVIARGAVARRLVELGLARASDHLVGSDAAEMLEHAGHVERVAAVVEVGDVRLDRVAARIGSLAGGALGDVAFTQITMSAWQSHESLERSGERLIQPDERGDTGRISDLPDEADPDGDDPIVGLARLRAHLAGEAVGYEVLAVDRGPFLDLPIVLGLLNALLRQAGSALRLVVLRGQGREAKVIVGEASAIEKAAEEGLLLLEGPDDALLRSFEDDVLEPS